MVEVGHLGEGQVGILLIGAAATTAAAHLRQVARSLLALAQEHDELVGGALMFEALLHLVAVELLQAFVEQIVLELVGVHFYVEQVLSGQNAGAAVVVVVVGIEV